MEVTKADCDVVFIHGLAYLSSISSFYLETDGWHTARVISIFDTDNATVLAAAQIAEQTLCKLVLMICDEVER